MFWSSQVSQKLESLRSAEANLVALARRFGGRDPASYEMKVFDTAIPRSSIPLKSMEEDEELNIHGVRISSKEHHPESTKTPLVLQHGYMNGGLYFFRNLVGLSHYFQNVYAIDMLDGACRPDRTFDLRMIQLKPPKNSS